MNIKFDGNQNYQLDAINAIVNVFDGQPLAQGEFEIHFEAARGERLAELGVGNQLVIDKNTIIKNVRAIQKNNGIAKTDKFHDMNFSVEMETGTGKTYVYLRTIYELEKKYGFKKFIIVVPSVAIREGVLKSLELTREHFAEFYGSIPVEAWVYDSRQVSKLRQFAGGNQLQILIINIDAFNKKTNNVIHQENDKLSGRKPIEFIQAAQPFVIMDEPQNMESDRARAAIKSLNPLAAFRYSATHRNLYNLVYKLDPVRAYDLKLVKRIEVDSVLEDENFNQPYIYVKSITAAKSKITAKLDIDVRGKNSPQRKTISIHKAHIDLFDLSGKRENYRGYVVECIDAGKQYISFCNGISLDAGETHGAHTDDIMRVQVRQTVIKHLEKELGIHKKYPEGRRMKILSLFFIDRVANYADEDGKIRQWFIEAYEKYAKRKKYQELKLPPAEKVHNGYFAQSKGKPKDTRGNSKADDEAYALIMRDKERLLALDEPLRFIFSHSALREGWDNPNIFQICTLNETRSEMKKRQEIGRGLRLPVTETGERCFDDNVNTLTVVANESYEDFALKLQTEIEEECGVSFGEGRIKNHRDRHTIRLKKGWRFNEDFIELWNRIKHKTRYSVKYSTDKLIDRAADELSKMPAIEKPIIRTQTTKIELSGKGLIPAISAVMEDDIVYGTMRIPDLLGYLQRETELTRDTLAAILVKSDTLGNVVTNPQQYLDQATKALKNTLNRIIIDGVKYERIADAEYEMLLFEKNEIIAYLNRMVDVEHSIYDAIEFDSEVEREFAETLDKRNDIKLFIKLPGWFKVDTPIGAYNPDWAIVKQSEGEDAKLYLVRETKGTKDQHKLRGSEWAKLQCGYACFNSLAVDFKHVASANEV